MDQTVSSPVPASRSAPLQVRSLLRSIAVPVLAVVTAVIIGSIFILLAGLDPFKAYQGLVQGALGSDTGLTRSLIKMAPYILSGLAVAFAFKGGLFNIGAQGQLVVGALLFGFATALQGQLQFLGGEKVIPHQFVAMLPYILTLVVLAGFVGRARLPAHVGQAYEVE